MTHGDHTKPAAAHIPLALAELHRNVHTDAEVLLSLPHGLTNFRDVVEGGGFAIENIDDQVPGPIRVRARRRLTLPDTVGPDMMVLICGLNPSVHAAEAGVGFVTANNRFWAGAQAAGLVSVDRDPFAALTGDGIGMTDLVKRATRRADELDDAEYREGLGRVERLVAWLDPRVVCFVGLTGWRVAVDRMATAGLQAHPLGGRPAYVMPSTSGLNAHTQLPDVIEHFAAVRRLVERSG